MNENLSVERIAELTAGAVVGQLKDDYIVPMIKTQGEMVQRISSLEQTVIASNGVKQQVSDIRTDRDRQREKCQSQFNVLGAAVKEFSDHVESEQRSAERQEQKRHLTRTELIMTASTVLTAVGLLYHILSAKPH
jgi:hypothetical protein